MNCPVCKDQALTRQPLETNLCSCACEKCKGKWVASHQYWKWKESSGKALTANKPVPGADLPVEDSTGAKLCPECGHFLRRFPVGQGLGFDLNHCGNCGGTWFDANEWENLKNRGLHDDVHKIFSEVWQNQVRSDEHTAAMEAFYKEKFGDEGYRKAVDLKAWIDTHPHNAELRAFLGL
ncbi:MAG: zf-TFIIB domain-containing protein [Planctomycetota bacterium]|jgi:Zn-finger nucleic acid-binding protein